MKQALTIAAVLLWTVSGTLLAFALCEDDSWRMSQFALFLQLGACVPTFYLIAEHVLAAHRRKMLVRLAEVVGRADAQRGVRNLREARN